MKNKLIMTLLLFTSISAMAQNVTGRVVDENNSPLSFVNVILLKVDSSFIAGTVTDENGVFVLCEQNGTPRILKLSSVGYVNQVLDIPPTGDLGVISLRPDTVMIGEVVVIKSLK